MKNINTKYDKKITMIFIALALMYIGLIIWLPIAKGHDSFFHFTRINALALEIQENGILNYPFRIYTTMLDGYGYGNPLFYGDLFLLFPALLIVRGFSVNIAYKLFLLTIVIFAYIFMYICVYTISKSKEAAIKGALLYITACYYWITVFERGAIAEVIAFMFLPLASMGLYKIFNSDRKYEGVLSLTLGMSGIILSHVLSTVLTCVIFSIYCVINFKKINKKVIYKLILSVLLTIGLTAYFIFPMIEQLLSQKFYVNADEIKLGKRDLNRTSIPLLSLFLPGQALQWIKEVNNTLPIMIIGDYHWYPGGFGYIVVFAIIIRIIYRKNKNIKKYDGILLTTIFILIFISKIIPKGKLQQYLEFIQFPWRLLFFVTLLISIYIAIVSTEVKNRKVNIALVIVMILSFSVYSIKYFYVATYKGDTFDYNEYTSYKVGCAEYLPSLVESIDYLKDRGNLCDSNIDDITCTFENGVLTYNNNKAEDAWVEVPLLYYEGYSVVGDKTGYRIEESENGLVKVILANDIESNEIEISYTGTIIQKISNIISLITVIMLIMISAIIFIRSKIK